MAETFFGPTLPRDPSQETSTLGHAAIRTFDQNKEVRPCFDGDSFVVDLAFV